LFNQYEATLNIIPTSDSAQCLIFIPSSNRSGLTPGTPEQMNKKGSSQTNKMRENWRMFNNSSFTCSFVTQSFSSFPVSLHKLDSTFCFIHV